MSIYGADIISLEHKPIVPATGTNIPFHLYLPIGFPYQSYTLGLYMAGYPSVKKGNKIGQVAKRPIPGIALEKQIPIEKIEELIIKHKGNLSRVAESVGSTRHCLRDVCNRNPSLKKALDDARERWIDNIEESVLSRAEDSNDTALQCFVLKTQGRHRGWEQEDTKNVARDMVNEAFSFILNKSKNPAEKTK